MAAAAVGAVVPLAVTASLVTAAGYLYGLGRTVQASVSANENDRCAVTRADPWERVPRHAKVECGAERVGSPLDVTALPVASAW